VPNEPEGTASSVGQTIGQKLLLAFPGKDRLSREAQEAIRAYRPGGITLFRSLNVEDPAQVRQLTDMLQQAARQAGLPPLLIAADQEGGQLMAIGEGTTPLPGNLALGAAGSPELARQAGEVLGRELAAMGVNVDYAPCCDVNVNPDNPVIGTRSFGEDPQQVAKFSAALVAGLQSAGVAAAAKHFPGHGDTASDSHHGIPVVPHSLERLQQVEFLPFRAAIQAGAKLVMTAHLALPAVEWRSDLPATLSPAIIRGLLRGKLGFEGVVVTDAMDMKAIRQGEELGEEAVRSAAAGTDLLLMASDPLDQRRVHTGLERALQRGQLDSAEMAASVSRIMVLKNWLAEQGPQPDLALVGSPAHRTVADEIARRSVTLVRDQAGLLPLRPQEGQRLVVILPRPSDLTPADTSSYVTPALAEALRSFHSDVAEFILPHTPVEQDIAAVLQQVRRSDIVILGLLNAFAQPGQVALAQALLKSGNPVAIAALRMPYDLAALPEAGTFCCTYSILEPSMQALARALFGQARFQGRLPVSIPGLYPAGHGQAL
jgi:beta-N-acetylhexosaminidase